MGFPWRKIISLRKLVSDLRPIDILTGEIEVEVTGVVGVSPALWYFRYIASIFLTLHKRLCVHHLFQTSKVKSMLFSFNTIQCHANNNRLKYGYWYIVIFCTLILTCNLILYKDYQLYFLRAKYDKHFYSSMLWRFLSMFGRNIKL
jgi:hypothetical protein